MTVFLIIYVLSTLGLIYLKYLSGEVTLLDIIFSCFPLFNTIVLIIVLLNDFKHIVIYRE